MLGGLLGKASAALTGGRAAAGAYARDIGKRAMNRGTNIARSGMRELINPTGTYTRSEMVRTGGGVVAPGLFGTAGRVTAPTFTRANVTRKMPGLAGSFTFQAMPRFAAASAIEWYASTPAGEESSGFGRALMGGAAFGLRVGAYRHMARGVSGSALSMGGRAIGNPSKFGNAYSWIHTKTGNLATKGSLTNLAFRGAKGIGKEALKLPFRMAIGSGYGAYAGVRGLSRLAGSAGESMGMGATMLGLKRTGSVLNWASRVAGSMGKADMSRIMSPRLTPFKSFNMGVHNKTGLINKHGHAPVMSGMVGLGMFAGAANAAWRREDTPYNMRGLNPASKHGINSAYYGAGIERVRRGNTRNYGPSLTLQMHRNHSRVMP